MMNVSVCTYVSQTIAPFSALLLNGPLTTFCTIVGCFGNMFSISLARKMNIGNVLRNFMVVLAMWDSGVLMCTFCYYGLYNTMAVTFNHRFEQQGLWAYLVAIFHGPLSITITGSTWTTVAIACTRYFVVLCPLRSVTVRAFSQSCYPNVVIFVCAIVYCIPCFFELTLETCFDLNIHDIVVQVWPWLLYNKRYQILYRTICYTTFVSVGPFVATLIMSIHTIYLLKKRNNQHLRFMPRSKTIRRTNKSHWRIGILFFVLLGKFLLCYSVPTVLMLSFSFIGPELFKYEVMKVVSDVGNFLVVLNSSTNFLVYMLWDKYGTTNSRKRILHRTDDMEYSFSTIGTASDLQLTTFETNVLYKSWLDMKKQRGRKLFSRLIMYLFEEQENAEQMLGIRSMANQTHNMVVFFDKIVSETYNDSGCKLPTSYIQQMGRIHQRRGIKLTNEVLRNFKCFVLEEVSNRRTSQSAVDLSAMANKNIQSAEIRIWNRLLSAIIAEMKLGYMATPSIRARHLTVTQPNVRSPFIKTNRTRNRKFTM